MDDDDAQAWREPGIFHAQYLPSVREPSGPLLMECCPSWFMLPNAEALAPEMAEIYVRMGFNAQEIELIAKAGPSGMSTIGPAY